MIHITDVMDEEFCGSLCFMEPNCISYNFKLLASQTGVHKCELNNSTHEGHEDDLEENPNYLYRGAEVRIVTFDSSPPPPLHPQKKKKKFNVTITAIALKPNNNGLPSAVKVLRHFRFKGYVLGRKQSRTLIPLPPPPPNQGCVT